MACPGGLKHGVALFQIVGKAVVPFVIPEVVQKNSSELILAIVGEGGVAVAIGDESVIPILHGQKEQFTALFFAVAQGVFLVEGLSGLIDRIIIDIVCEVVQHDDIHAAFIF